MQNTVATADAGSATQAGFLAFPVHRAGTRQQTCIGRACVFWHAPCVCTAFTSTVNMIKQS